MSTEFPTNLDNLSNPTGEEALLSTTPALRHSTQHGNANDAIEALEAKVGVDDSDDPDSLDYKVRNGGALRRTTSVTTDSIGKDTTDSAKTVPLGKGNIALKISTNYPAWVRVYASVDAQTADATRTIDLDPASGSGVLLEVLTAAGALEIVLSPTATLFSADGTDNLPVSITNKDSVSRAITAIITTVPVEG